MALPSTATHRTTVAIIGAGLSGLAAATRLRADNVPFLILEAGSRIGGRVHTVSAQCATGNFYFDLGATWFHGTVGNAAYDIAVDAGVVQRAEGEVDDIDYGLLVFSEGGVYMTREGDRKDLDRDLAVDVARRYGKAWDEVDEGVGLDESFWEYVKDRAGWDGMDVMERAIFRSRDRLECCINGCDGSTADLAVGRVGEYETLKGDNVSVIEGGGMMTVVNALMSEIDVGDVMLDSKVVHVDWSRDEVRVQVQGGGVVVANCVVWTPSVNVTKAAVKKDFFTPPLGKEKVEALNGRGMGVVNKLFAILKAPVNTVAGSAVPIVWQVNGEGEGDSWKHSIYALTYDDERLTVCMWLCGSSADDLHKMSGDERREELSRVLSDLYGQQVEVEGVLASNWGTALTLGSYSYASVGGKRGDTAILGAPMPSEEWPRLCFAGEGTHERFYSTMHGAIDRGRREAERCVRFLAGRGVVEMIG